ncbi:MAG: autotransporter-associated beta strand repeat-containing protein [Verrucomicrobia bacterium]|nr:autotransporter-associated beta strand repeat-containing protein [Verrucomicrobiota bacterium]
MKPSFNPLLIASALLSSGIAQAADYNWGTTTQNFTINRTDWGRDMPAYGTIDNSTGDMGIYWRGSSADRTYIHFDLSSLAGVTLTSNVSLNCAVNAQWGGVVTGSTVNTVNAAWTASNGSTAPGITTIAGATNATGTFTTGQIASWVVPQATFASYIGSPAYYGLALQGANGTTAHFNGTSTLTGSYTAGLVRVIGGTDWSAVTWDGGSSTATLASADASGGNLIISPGCTFSVTGTGTLGTGTFSGTISNAGTLSIDSSASQTLGGAISGAGGLTKSGNGTLKLTSVNSYTGAININGGTLEAAAATSGNASAIGNGSNTVNVATGATLLFSTNGRTAGYHSGTVNLNGGTITFNSADVSFASGRTLTLDIAPCTIDGSGQWRMRDANAKVAVTAAASGSTISVADLRLTTGGGGVHTFDVADGTATSDLTISSAVSGHFGGEKLTKSGDGTLALTGTNTYTGTTTVNGGTLALAGTLAGPVTVNAATLAGTGTLSNTVGISASGAIEPGGAGTTGTLTVNNTLTLAGETRMELTKTGATLDCDRIAGTGAVAFGGILKITASGDALQLGDSFQLFTGSGGFSQTFSSVETPALGTGLSWDITQLAVDGTITVVNYAAVPIFSIPAGGYIGAQSITLTSEPGATIYYTLDGSVPTLGSASGASPLSGITIPLSSTVTIRAFATKPGQASSTEASAVYTTIPTAVWNVDDNGLWSESAKWLESAIPDGAEIPVDFLTTSQLADTTVTLDSNRTVGSMTFGNANPINWTLAASNGAVLTLDNGAATPAITVDSNTATIAAPLAGFNGLDIGGAGTLVLSGANTYAGDTTVASGTTLKLGAADRLPDGGGKGNLALSGTLDLAGFSDTVNALTGNGPVVKSGAGTSTLTIGGADTTFTYDGVISNTEGTLSLRKNGTGTTTLTGIHAYNGTTTVNGGTLELPTGSSIGTATSGRVIAAAGTLALSGGTITTNGQGTFLAESTAATFNHSAGNLVMNAPVQYWDVVVGQFAAATWNQTGGTANLNIGALYVGNNIGSAGTALNLSGGSFSINGTAGTTDRGLILAVRADAALNITGTAAVTIPVLQYGHSPGVSLAGITGTVNLDGGTLTAETVKKNSAGTAIFNFNGGLLKVPATTTTLMSGLTTANVRDGGARIDTNGFTATLAQPLVHSTVGGDAATDGGLTKSGTGKLVLTGSSNFTGNTAVNAGTLQVDGELTASPQVTVAGGATLGGSGTISGTVIADGSVAPGASVGTLATGSVDLTGGTYACEIDGATADRLNVTGDLDLTGATLAVTALNPATFTGSVVILTYTGTLTGDFGTPALPSGITLEHDANAKEFRLVRGGDFYAWATANSVTGGPNGDSDNDGIRNLVEYALALNPAGADGQAGSYNPATGAISFTKRQDAIDNGDVTYIIQTSPDLVNWTPAVTHGSGNTSTTISTTLTVDGPKKFARLSVTTSATAP